MCLTREGPGASCSGPLSCCVLVLCAAASGSGAAAAREARQQTEADTARDHRGGADQQERGLGGTRLGQLPLLALGGGVGRGVRAGVGQTGGTLALLDGLGAAVGLLSLPPVPVPEPSVGVSVGSVGSVGSSVGSGGLVRRRRGGGRGRAGRRGRDGGRLRGVGVPGVVVGVAVPVGMPVTVGVALGSPSTVTPTLMSRAEAAPAAVSEAPAAITTPAAMRATRIRVFLVICLLPPVADRQWSSARGHGVTGGSLSPPVHMRPGDTHATRHHSQFSQQRQGRCVRDVRISDICLPCGHVTVT